MIDNKQVIDNNTELLSVRRGNAFGFGFFRMLLRTLGLRGAGAFLWPVAFFYALFDRTARERARPVMDCLHPQESALRRFWHTWRLFTNQGRAILLANYLSDSGKEITVITEKDPAAVPLTDTAEQPVVVVSSHFGAWQAAFINSRLIRRSITFLDRPDLKAVLDKFQTVRAEAGQVAEITQNQSSTGGLVEAMNALMRKEMVGMMGDRAIGGTAVRLPFGARELDFLASPWLLAARTHAPVLVFLVGLDWEKKEIICRFSQPILPADIPERRIRPDDLRPAIAAYAREIEQFCRRFPDQWFKFEG